MRLRISDRRDPLGGSGIGYWQPVAEKYGINIEVANPRVDPTFSFMSVDKDGTVWTTDKDGFILALLAADITARTNKDPSEHWMHRSGVHNL